MISYEFKQFLNEKIIDNLPTGFVKIGNKYNGRCPFCGDSKKSSRKKRGWIYLENASYHCFNCGINLSGMKFLELICGSRYQEIKHQFTRMFVKAELSAHMDIGLSEFKEEDLDIFNVKSILDPSRKKPLSKDAKNYLSNRKVLEAPFLKDNLYSTYSNDGSEYILIPWTINGCEGAYYQLNDFKSNGDIKYIFPRDHKKLIYGLDNIDVSFPYIICFEGVYDSLFVKNGVATGTKSLTTFQMNILKRRFPHHQICIAFDNDIPGIWAMSKMIKAGMDFKYLKWFNKQTKAKDINDYVLEKNDVNIFADSKKVERLIVSPMKMKLRLIENGMWGIKERNDTCKSEQKRKIQ